MIHHHRESYQKVEGYGTKVNNVIIHYTKRSKVNITITFYKQEYSNLILQREMIPAHRMEHMRVKDFS